MLNITHSYIHSLSVALQPTTITWLIHACGMTYSNVWHDIFIQNPKHAHTHTHARKHTHTFIHKISHTHTHSLSVAQQPSTIIVVRRRGFEFSWEGMGDTVSSWFRPQVYICQCIYLCVYVYMPMYISMCKYTGIYAYIYIYMNIYVYIYICIYIHKYMYTQVDQVN